jgi:hypothetical protein
MNDEAILLLYNELKNTYDVGSLDDFKNYLMDDNKKEMFFNQVIKPEYDVDNIETFDEVYGLKKKRRIRFYYSRSKWGIGYGRHFFGYTTTN